MLPMRRIVPNKTTLLSPPPRPLMDTAKSRPARAGQMAGAMAESAALWKRMVTAKVSRSDGLW
jgi:hypothetical protein